MQVGRLIGTKIYLTYSNQSLREHLERARGEYTASIDPRWTSRERGQCDFDGEAMTDLLLIIFIVIILANWWFASQYLERLDKDLDDIRQSLGDDDETD